VNPNMGSNYVQRKEEVVLQNIKGKYE